MSPSLRPDQVSSINSASLTANSPITTTRNSTPSKRLGIPKVKRITPVALSIPIIASIRPIRTPISVLSGRAPTSVARHAKAKTIRAT